MSVTLVKAAQSTLLPGTARGGVYPGAMSSRLASRAPAVRLSLVAALLAATLALCLSPSPAPAGESGGQPKFKGSIERIDAELRERMTGNSWHRGCPVPLRNLRLLTVRHWNFEGEPKTGFVVVHADASRDILGVMRKLYELRFAIRRMRLVDAYGSNDRRSMRADNTSAFNCREIAGRPGVWSQHAYGRAIDVNPVENPYVSGGYVSPPAGAPYADRHPHRKGMINARGKVVKTFADAGWGWGGTWSGERDYQHFSATGG